MLFPSNPTIEDLLQLGLTKDASEKLLKNNYVNGHSINYELIEVIDDD